MDRKYFMFIDTTPNSETLTLQANPLFNTWMNFFDKRNKALEFITERPIPYSTNIYIAKDNILDNGLFESNSGQMRTLLKTFDDLQSIQHVAVFSSDPITDIDTQIRCILDQPRLLTEVISLNNLHCHMCTKGIQYLNELINHYKSTEEAHLIDNIQRNIDELYEYIGELIAKRKQRLAAIQEEHSNKHGQQPS